MLLTSEIGFILWSLFCYSFGILMCYLGVKYDEREKEIKERNMRIDKIYEMLNDKNE